MIAKNTCSQRRKNCTLEYQSDKAMTPPFGTSYLISADDFNLNATIESGQVFGFRKALDPPDRQAGGAYEGEAAGVWARLCMQGKSLRVETEASVDPATFTDYFDLARDLKPLYVILSADERLRPALALRGLRLIRQDAWEALACFIISANNNVKRIQGIWKNLAGRLGEPDITGRRRFPTAGRLAFAHERLLRELGLGYRAPFLLRTALFISANPGSLAHIRACGYEEARQRVLAFPGIGEKVADCALLYGFQKFEAFPVDVWIARAMRKLYFRNRGITETRLRCFAQKRWGRDAGYVQQYIFHAVRTGLF